MWSARREDVRASRPPALAPSAPLTRTRVRAPDTHARAVRASARQLIPATSQYRKDVEATFAYRSKVANESADEDVIEDTIGMGQLEELIVQANDETKVIKMYSEHKLWEAVEELHKV